MSSGTRSLFQADPIFRPAHFPLLLFPRLRPPMKSGSRRTPHVQIEEACGGPNLFSPVFIVFRLGRQSPPPHPRECAQWQRPSLTDCSRPSGKRCYPRASPHMNHAWPVVCMQIFSRSNKHNLTLTSFNWPRSLVFETYRSWQHSFAFCYACHLKIA